jgi:hypothetical protein
VSSPPRQFSADETVPPIAIVLVVLFASLALYGTDANFNLTV